MTQDYYGTKRVTAWKQGKDEGNDVQKDGYAVKYSDGYTSWSPSEAFEAAYQPISAMSFGHAIAALKAGDLVARAGWNGKGMFLWLEPGSTVDRETDQLIGGVSTDHFLAVSEGATTRMPHLCMRAADGSTVTGWLASQTDLLAEDWAIVSA